MRFELKKTITQVSVLTALLPSAALLVGQAQAHERQVPSPKLDPASAPARGTYVYDVFGRVVRTTVTGECVATGFWTPEGATQECHPGAFAEPQARAAPPAPPPPAEVTVTEYQAAEYAERPDYEAAPYAEAPAEEAAVLEEEELVAEEEIFEEEEVVEEEELIEEEELVAEEAAVASEAAAPEMPEFTEEVVEEQVEEFVAPQAPEEEAAVASEAAESVMPEFKEEVVEEQVEEFVAPQAVAEQPAVASETPEAVMPEFKEEVIVEEQVEEFVAPQAEEEETIITYEEEVIEQDDGIVSQYEYFEEEEIVTDDGIIAESQYYEEEERQPEELISEPQPAPEPPVAVAETPVAAPETPVAVAEAPQAQPVEPAPAPEPPKPVVLPVTITVDAEALFDFDRYGIRSDAQRELDELIEGLAGLEYGEILAVGHADRIGTVVYNQSLSQQRAASVKKYLIAKGIPAERIKTEARGELDPATAPQACGGLRKQKLIDCLQPDRRVEITVTGQRMPQ